jgi:hypothetical protein
VKKVSVSGENIDVPPRKDVSCFLVDSPA